MPQNESIDLCLGSASPRRRELLESVGLKVNVCPAAIDELIRPNEKAKDYVLRLAKEKAIAVSEKYPEQRPLPILASDTIVVCGDDVFEKPSNFDDARRMWESLSGGVHQVMTSVVLLYSTQEVVQCDVDLSVSTVQMNDLDAQTMERYWQTGEPEGKAGAYAIQGLAAAWVKSVNGSHSGIMGLPLFETNRLLSKVGLNWL